jgi:hypothetical protein
MQTLLLNSCPVQSVAAKITAPIRLHCLFFQVVYHPFISLEEPPKGNANQNHYSRKHSTDGRLSQQKTGENVSKNDQLD